MQNIFDINECLRVTDGLVQPMDKVAVRYGSRELSLFVSYFHRDAQKSSY